MTDLKSEVEKAAETLREIVETPNIFELAALRAVELRLAFRDLGRTHHDA